MILNKCFIFHIFTFLFISSAQLQSVTSEEIQDYITNQKESDLVEILMTYGDSKDDPILNRAMSAKDYFAVIALIEYGVDINSRKSNFRKDNPNQIGYYEISPGKTVLEEAVESREISLIEYFLSHHADPTIPRNYSCFSGAKTCNYCGFETAIYNSIKINSLDNLILFSKYGVDFTEICYSIGPNNGQYTLTPLQASINFQRKDIVAFLLSIGVKI